MKNRISLRVDEITPFHVHQAFTAETIIMLNSGALTIGELISQDEVKSDIYSRAVEAVYDFHFKDSLDEGERSQLRSKGFEFSEEGELLLDRGDAERKLVRVLEFNINKDAVGEPYIYLLIADPLDRVWEFSPYEYLEGWHYLEDFQPSVNAYRILNNEQTDQ